jgi:hypothetical protein
MPIADITNGESGSSVRGKLNDVIGIINGADAFTAVSIAQGTLTNPATGLSLTATWNDAADTFRGVDIVITDTNSAAASTPLRILGGAAGTTELLSLLKDGTLKAVNFGASDYSTTEIRGVYVRAAGFVISGEFRTDGNKCGIINLPGGTDGELCFQSPLGQFSKLQLGTNHATTPTAQTIQAHNVTTGTGASLTLAGGTGSVAKGNVVLDGGNRAAYDASPSATTIRDILISHGLMAAS